ncbi:hypothetical protein [Nocardia jejuensis]|uniref:hypothetical protein n=1 Tax=Nocardia jejuensis TaxID=328049 RepID=UPI00083199E3|nr:hypothetical protein [Nocardia jejuensis]
MTEIHPDVQSALDAARELRHRIADLREKINSIRARRPSPSGAVLPEVDAMGRLTDLYFAPGTTTRFGNTELVAEIMAAIDESTTDAGRQYKAIMDVEPWPEQAASNPAVTAVGELA